MPAYLGKVCLNRDCEAFWSGIMHSPNQETCFECGKILYITDEEFWKARDNLLGISEELKSKQ